MIVVGNNFLFFCWHALRRIALPYCLAVWCRISRMTVPNHPGLFFFEWPNFAPVRSTWGQRVDRFYYWSTLGIKVFSAANTCLRTPWKWYSDSAQGFSGWQGQGFLLSPMIILFTLLSNIIYFICYCMCVKVFGSNFLQFPKLLKSYLDTLNYLFSHF